MIPFLLKNYLQSFKFMLLYICNQEGDIKNMTDKEIATTILTQLGGRKFAVMTGSKDFSVIKNGLTMKLAVNPSKANRLDITLNGDDTYTMRFYKYSAPRLNNKTFEFSQSKTTEIKKFEGVYFDQLQELFTETTKMYTRLF